MTLILEQRLKLARKTGAIELREGRWSFDNQFTFVVELGELPAHVCDMLNVLRIDVHGCLLVSLHAYML